MRKNSLFLLFIFLFSFSNAQIWENFNNGNLSNWFGNVDSFTVNSSFQLQLNANGAGQSYVSTPLQLTNLNEDREWKFWIRENFAPSNNNYARFYLLSNNSNLLDTNNLQGYYLRFGEGGSLDAVRLFRLQGGVSTLLCSALQGAIANNFAIRIRVKRTAGGEWILYCSDNGSSILKEEARCVDASVSACNCIGLACYYTQGNRTNFYFDDIYCDKIYPDTLAPHITNITLNETTKNEITLTFSEDIDSSALITSSYEVNHQIGYPSSVTFSATSLSQVILHYNTPFPVNIPFTLHIRNLSDIAGNTMKDTVLPFMFYQSQLFDIVISEIMSKPSPVVNLPDAEYVELRNRTNYPINLSGWQLQLGNTSRTLSHTVMAANGYALVTAASNAPLFSNYGTTATISSMQITNSGQTIRLSDNKGNLVHFVTFSDAWHENGIKQNGGWSLEMKDIHNPCEEENNWSSSQNNSGGTPCKENSISTHNPDITNPQVDMVAHEGKNCISVYFSETMLLHTLRNKNAYQFSHNLQIDSILSISDNLHSVRLSLSDTLRPDVVYTLKITDTLFDCVKNAVPLSSSISFGYASSPAVNDLVINEILFNPLVNGVEFVEIYNRSHKIIDLRTLRLSTYKSNGDMDTGKVVSPLGRQLFPQQYLVLTTKPEVVQSQYDCPAVENFVRMNALPAYANTKGTVILLRNMDMEVLDLFTYSEKMHYPLLRSYKGVSLERIHFDRKTQDEFNWHSAASTVGYATPGYKNSSFSENSVQTSHFEVYPETFSPDNDGYNDNLNISYSFPQAGYRASIHIYNVAGKRLRTLVNNQLLDTEGYFTWDGIIDGNLKASVGTYIILIEYWNLEGEANRVKKACTLAIKF